MSRHAYRLAAPPREPRVHPPDRTRPVERFALVFHARAASLFRPELPGLLLAQAAARTAAVRAGNDRRHRRRSGEVGNAPGPHRALVGCARVQPRWRPQPVLRSEEHTSELQSLMRNSYAVLCLKKKT